METCVATKCTITCSCSLLTTHLIDEKISYGLKFTIVYI